MNYSTVIWDIDGTLINSKEGLVSSYHYTIDKLNLEKKTDKELASYIGPTPQTNFLTHFNMDKISAQAAADIFREHYKTKDLFKAYVYDGIDYILENLKKSDIHQAIATNKREDYAIDIIKHFGLDKYFDTIHGADNNNKLTKKDLINNCLSDLNTRPEETIFIGDSASDGLAAAEAGCQFIAVTYGFGFKNSNDTARFNPLLTVNNVDEIIKFFKQL